MALQFNEETHEYKADGIVIPSVTQVLHAAGLDGLHDVPRSLLQRNALFGKAVHKAIELRCAKTLDMSTVDDPIIPYLKHWEKFCQDYGYTPDMWEVRGANTALGVGYTIDNIGSANKATTIVDVKTGHPKPSDIIQISAYGYVYPVKNLYLLYLSIEGWKVQPVKNTERKRAESIFLSALNVYKFRKEHGLLWTE